MTLSGWLVSDKPSGISSFDVIRTLKTSYQGKVGYVGTLDPLATGVLPLALGEATKCISMVIEGRKTYEVTVRWGVKTDTGDCEGNKLLTSPHSPTQQEVERVATSFLDRQYWQRPHPFSAVKVKGKRAYQLARAGNPVTLPPRAVSLFSFSCSSPSSFSLQCSKGFYVRSFVEDLAKPLNTYAHITALRRIEAAPFHIKQAFSLQKNMTLAHLKTLVMPIEAALSEHCALTVTRQQERDLCLGKKVKVTAVRTRGEKSFYGWARGEEGKCVALVTGLLHTDGIVLIPKCVLVR